MRRLPLVVLSCLAAIPVFASAAEVVSIAGTGAPTYSGDGGPSNAAAINSPYGIARGPDGALYFCDCDNQRIRRIGLDGVISTAAGNGTRGYSGDGGPATDAALDEPYEIHFDPAGSMYFVERLNHIVRRVDGATHIISTVAGTGKQGFSGDGGPATAALLKQPHSLAIDKTGDIFICDIGNNRIRRVDMKTGLISTFAGNGSKPPTEDGALFSNIALHGPRSIDFDAAGNLWVATRESNIIYKLDLAEGRVHRIAGTGKMGFTGNGGLATEATLDSPKGLSCGPDGNVYFADTESHSIRMIDVARGTIDVVIGNGEKGDGPDGDALACKMIRPHGVFVDADGSIYVGDTEAHRVRLLKRGEK